MPKSADEKAKQLKREKKAAKDKARRLKALQPAVAPKNLKGFPEDVQLFWLAHGVNCIVSDYAEGTWTPLFEGIYDGKLPANREEIQGLILQRFSFGQGWSPKVKAALAWSVADTNLLYVYWHEAMRRMQRAHPDLEPEAIAPLIRRPADGCVWGMFDYLMDNLLRRKAL